MLGPPLIVVCSAYRGWNRIGDEEGNQGFKRPMAGFFKKECVVHLELVSLRHAERILHSKRDARCERQISITECNAIDMAAPVRGARQTSPWAHLPSLRLDGKLLVVSVADEPFSWTHAAKRLGVCLRLGHGQTTLEGGE